MAWDRFLRGDGFHETERLSFGELLMAEFLIKELFAAQKLQIIKIHKLTQHQSPRTLFVFRENLLQGVILATAHESDVHFSMSREGFSVICSSKQ